MQAFSCSLQRRQAGLKLPPNRLAVVLSTAFCNPLLLLCSVGTYRSLSGGGCRMPRLQRRPPRRPRLQRRRCRGMLRRRQARVTKRSRLRLRQKPKRHAARMLSRQRLHLSCFCRCYVLLQSCADLQGLVASLRCSGFACVGNVLAGILVMQCKSTWRQQ